VGKDLKVLGGVTEAAAKEGGAGKAVGEVCNLFNSFTPDTPALLASGKRVRIDRVKVGDKVLAQDPKTGRQAAEPVERIIIGQGLKHLVTIAVPGETLVATDAHPFYVRQANDFVTAGELQAGEQLELSTGTWVTIASVKHRDEVLRVYNLSVGELHTFFAGDRAVLVHNCGGGAPQLSYREGAEALARKTDPFHTFPLSRDAEILAKGELTKLDAATGYNQLELAGTFRTANKLYLGKYQLGGFLAEDNLFEVTHRLFKPETWLGG
jgi:hypothetical protein